MRQNLLLWVRHLILFYRQRLYLNNTLFILNHIIQEAEKMLKKGALWEKLFLNGVVRPRICCNCEAPLPLPDDCQDVVYSE